MKIQVQICHERHSLLATEYFTRMKRMYGHCVVCTSDTTFVYIVFAANRANKSIIDLVSQEKPSLLSRETIFIVSVSGAFKQICYLKPSDTCKKAINMNCNFHLYGFLHD